MLEENIKAINTAMNCMQNIISSVEKDVFMYEVTKNKEKKRHSVVETLTEEKRLAQEDLQELELEKIRLQVRKLFFKSF